MVKKRFFCGVFWILMPLIFLAAVSENKIHASEGGDSVIVAGIILKWAPKDLQKNYQRFEALVREAARQKAQIVCTTECFLDGYCVRDTSMSAKEFLAYSENNKNGEYITRMKKLTRELGIYLIAGLSEVQEDKVYNSAILFGPEGKIIGTYRKNYLWGYEKEKFTAGIGYPVFASLFGKIGMMICFERQKPEVVKALKKNGADIIFCLSGGGFGEANDRIVSRRSMESQLPIVFVHPVEFLITGPKGNTLSRHISGSQLDDNGKESPYGVVKMYELKILR